MIYVDEWGKKGECRKCKKPTVKGEKRVCFEEHGGYHADTRRYCPKCGVLLIEEELARLHRFLSEFIPFIEDDDLKKRVIANKL